MKFLSLICALFLFSAGAQASLTLSSDAFNNNTSIPLQYSGKGQDISPPLAWSNAPSETKSYALICNDPDAPSGTWTHFVLYNIPSTVNHIDEGKLPKEAALGKNSWGKTTYNGPNPPSGTHHYVFTLYALDASLALPSGLTSDQLQQAMAGHVLDKATLTGVFSKQ